MTTPSECTKETDTTGMHREAGDEINSCNLITLPSIEEIYDMGLETLERLKAMLEVKLYVRNSEKIRDENLNYCESLEKIFPFVLSEIKERQYADKVVNFFLTTNYETFFQTLTNNSASDSEKFNPMRGIETDTNTLKQQEVTTINTNLNNEQNFHFVNKESIKQLLSKTKLDSNSIKVTVGCSLHPQDSYRNIKHIKTALYKTKTIPSLNNLYHNKNEETTHLKVNYEAQVKDIPSAQLKVNYETRMKDDIPIKINFNSLSSISGRQKTKRQLEKHAESKESLPSQLELRRRYVVPDIKMLIKKAEQSEEKRLIMGNNNDNIITFNKLKILQPEATKCESSVVSPGTTISQPGQNNFYSSDSHTEVVLKKDVEIFTNDERERNSNKIYLQQQNISSASNAIAENEEKTNDNNIQDHNRNISASENPSKDIPQKGISIKEMKASLKIDKRLIEVSKSLQIDNEEDCHNLEKENRIAIKSKDKEVEIRKENDIGDQQSVNSNIHNAITLKSNDKSMSTTDMISLLKAEGKWWDSTIENTSHSNLVQEGKRKPHVDDCFSGLASFGAENSEEGAEDVNGLIITRKHTQQKVVESYPHTHIHTRLPSPPKIILESQDRTITNLNQMKTHSNGFTKEKNQIKQNGQVWNKTTSNFYSKKQNKNNPATASSRINSFNERKRSALAMLKARSNSSKLPIINHGVLSNALNIKDYSHLYKNFNELFNGYFLSPNYSQTKIFNPGEALVCLYDSFKNLQLYEKTEDDAEKENVSKDVVQAEAGIIKNRLQQVCDKLLSENDLMTDDRYYVLRNVLELQKKEYGRRANDMSIVPIGKMFFRVVLSRPEIYDIMCYTLGVKDEWRELPHGLLLGQSWNLLWTYSTPSIDHNKLFSFQKVNHLINNRMLSRKDLLKKCIDRVRKMNKTLNKQFDIMPKTFLLAKEYIDFVDEFLKYGKDNPLNWWIVKPVGKSRGRGIYITNDISEVPLADSFLVQQYLTNPLLLDGFKFDMRIYVLVTSVNPLEVFLYKDGFARLSNEQFNLKTKDRKIHLTNAAIQSKYCKGSSNYQKVYGGSKISLDLLKSKLYRSDISFEGIWKQVKDIILKSLIACQHEIPYSPSTFELFGYDIIVDENLRCWLLEVNSSPSLERANVLDDQIKLPLVDDILKVVQPMNFDRDALVKVIERMMKIHSTKSNEVYLYSPAVQLNMDLSQIFRGEYPRAYGEMPRNIGKFERICPSDESERLIKITGGQKYFGNKRDML